MQPDDPKIRSFRLAATAAVGAALLAVCALSAFGAAVDYFLQIPGIDGSSKDAAHKNWIVVQSFDLKSADTHPAPASGMAMRARSATSIVIVKEADVASPVIAKAQATGRHFASMTLQAVTAGKVTRTIILRDVAISTVEVGGTGGKTTEKLTLTATEVIETPEK